MSQVWKSGRILSILRGYLEQGIGKVVIVAAAAAVLVPPGKVLEGDAGGDGGQDGNVHLDGEAGRQFHLDEVSQFLEVFELRRDNLKSDKKGAMLLVVGGLLTPILRGRRSSGLSTWKCQLL